ncbi:MAG: hypothetical protein A3G81_01560 [Betaproteobacteria bacterium RIFCSPLOWO2_12_FULL_65_14]|nr:MAG: hypothetical protein A3G81_01560 [Betaproteobacteria bacterium RIFCSPLOWO2_12_FULL_65_14]
MEVRVDVEGYRQDFRTTIAGVTKQNADGSDRQCLVKALRAGEELALVREPNNQYDKYAIAVFRSTGGQLGYLPRGDRRLADHIDMGGAVTARVIKVTGGPGILGILFKSFRKSYGCVIEISKGDFNWKEVTPYLDKSREIENLIASARAVEAQDLQKAISTYRIAIDQIIEFDKAGPVAAAWRRARYPVNRLTLLLEKNGDLEGARAEIERYEQFQDVFQLTAEDAKSVASRKQRLSRKLHAKAGRKAPNP